MAVGANGTWVFSSFSGVARWALIHSSHTAAATTKEVGQQSKLGPPIFQVGEWHLVNWRRELLYRITYTINVGKHLKCGIHLCSISFIKCLLYARHCADCKIGKSRSIELWSWALVMRRDQVKCTSHYNKANYEKWHKTFQRHYM